MKIPYSWLCEFVDLSDVPASKVAELLTLRTCEVDAVHHVGAGLSGIRIGRVLDAHRHPNADTLNLTKVDAGTGEILPIVCGAPNVRTGQRVAVAVPGSRLPNGLEITERKLRGETSRGMICSERELGLGDDHDGIMVFEEDAVIGAPLTTLPSIEDHVIEIDNKSVNHRPDLWGIYGFAREISVILGRPLAPCTGAALEFIKNGPVPVEIEDPQRCMRYLAGVFEGLKPGPSPAWMQRRLRLLGARPISIMVDITNYVMFETGQPTHAFDAAKIRGGVITVRGAREGENLTTLDSVERRLQPSDLVIADREGAIGLAGVMGGANSEITDSTTRMVLESASFDAPTVRRTASRLSLRSEASARFEKSLDPNLAEVAMSRIAQLIQQIVPGARVAGPVTVAGAPMRQPLQIELDWKFVAERLGVGSLQQKAEQSSWERILTLLGCTVASAAPDRARAVVTVPSFRATKDLTAPIDLVEEIARLRGYENVAPVPLTAPVLPPPVQNGRRSLVRRIEDRLVAMQFRGLESYSFLSDGLVEALGLEGPFVTLRNSIVQGESRMRRSVLPSVVGHVARNMSMESDLRLFEVGKGYQPDRERVDPLIGALAGEPREVVTVAGVVASPVGAGGSARRFDGGMFFRAKGIVAAILEGLGLNAVFITMGQVPSKPAGESLPWIHPHRRLLVGTETGKTHRLLGFLGELHPEATARLGLSGAEVAGFELDLDALDAACTAAGPVKFEAPPRFPGIMVDVSIAASENVSCEALEALVKSANATLCRSTTLFDIYTGSELGPGRRSLAFHVELRSDERTLTVQDETAFLRAVASAAIAAGASLRGWQDSASS